MKSTSKAKAKPTGNLRREYAFDYSKARPNRFAGRSGPASVVVVLAPDVAKVFQTPESVNTALRALVAAMPRRAGRNPAH
jgi:hypothetical protein